jgi:hypothetical protein
LSKIHDVGLAWSEVKSCGCGFSVEGRSLACRGAGWCADSRTGILFRGHRLERSERGSCRNSTGRGRTGDLRLALLYDALQFYRGISLGEIRALFLEYPLQEISKIEPTHNPASSPALSLDRLVIYYNGGKVLMVSPADKQGFMNELKTRTRHRAAIR